MNVSLQKRLFNIAKYLLAIALVIVIYRYYFKMGQWKEVAGMLAHTPLWVFLLAFLIAMLNWYLESVKWRIMVSNLEKISAKTAFSSTLAGAAVSNIVPFRVGEYLGRMLYISKENRVPSALNSIMGSMSQMLVTLIMGIPFVSAMLSSNPKFSSLSRYALWLLLGVALLVVLIYLWVRRRKSGGNKLLNKLLNDLRSFKLAQLIKALLLSFARYFVFAGMYIFLLYYFGVHPNFYVLFSGVATVFFLQSFAPGMVLVDAGVRTSLPLVVLGTVAPNAGPAILTAASVNYAFNVFFPAITGCILLLYKRSTDLDQ